MSEIEESSLVVMACVLIGLALVLCGCVAKKEYMKMEGICKQLESNCETIRDENEDLAHALWDCRSGE